ncbi:MAG: glycosyltransferase family 4 protein [Gemmatimonadaceae bacterium]
MDRPLHAVHVSFYSDVERRAPEVLIEAWPTLLGVAAGLVRAGVETTVVQASVHRQTIDRDGVRLHFVNGSRALLHRVAALEADVVHVHGFTHPVALRRLVDGVRKTPVVVQDHASRAPAGWRRHLWRWAISPVAGVTFAAREQAEPFFAARAFPRGTRVFEVLEGSSTFTPGDQADARSATGLFGNPCLLWAAHLNVGKDPFTALDAFARAAKELPEARLWCCFGAAPLLPEVQRRIAASPVLRSRVTLLGRRPHAEMEQLFRAADFFVQTSHREGCSYSIIEALSCGTTPLVSDIPSSRRTVGDAGSLTPVGDASSLADAIVAWAARDRAALRLGARERFERALSFDAIGRELRAVYEAARGSA